MIRLGITGGIGMGKSAATDILRGFDVPVTDSDVIAREIVAPGQPALAEIRDAFGPEVLLPDGTLDRPRLAKAVFEEPSARLRLEAILHPRIRQEWIGRLNAWESEGHPIAAATIPLLYETGAENHFDVVACVACSRRSQSERLRRRGWTDAESARRIAAQLPVEEKMKRARFVIWTEPPLAEHALQWRRLLETLGIR